MSIVYGCVEKAFSSILFCRFHIRFVVFFFSLKYEKLVDIITIIIIWERILNENEPFYYCQIRTKKNVFFFLLFFELQFYEFVYNLIRMLFHVMYIHQGQFEQSIIQTHTHHFILVYSNSFEIVAFLSLSNNIQFYFITF